MPPKPYLALLATVIAAGAVTVALAATNAGAASAPILLPLMMAAVWLLRRR